MCEATNSVLERGLNDCSSSKPASSDGNCRKGGCAPVVGWVFQVLYAVGKSKDICVAFVGSGGQHIAHLGMMFVGGDHAQMRWPVTALISYKKPFLHVLKITGVFTLLMVTLPVACHQE